jgi:hypothetical protein
MIRTSLALLTVALSATIGLGLIGASLSDRWPWFTAGLGLFMLGQAARRFALSRALAAIRQRASVSAVKGLRTMCIAYVMAGGLFIAGAVTPLERALGLIVAVAALSWSSVWTWVLARSGAWVEPGATGMASEPGARNAAG